MKIENRKDIKDFVLDIENRFPVNDWKYNGIHLWPYLRIQLFFYLRESTLSNKQIELSFESKRLNEPGIIPKVFSKIYLASKYILWRSFLTKRENIFHGHSIHRVKFEEKYFNRFFDTLIADKSLSKKYWFFEKSNNSKDELFNKNNVILLDEKFNQYLAYYSIKKKVVRQKHALNLDGYDTFLQYLSSFNASTAFCKKFTVNFLQNWIETQFIPAYNFYIEILAKVQANRTYILCYYSDFAFVAAANKLKIETIEMQHGAQTEEHLGYGSWSKIPEKGYDFLPKVYWCWDEGSKNNIAKWTLKHTLYKCYVGGNPWVNFWLKREDSLEFNDFILYTLQPNLTLSELFSDQLINLIKTGKLKWFVRLHPRQMPEKNDIEIFLNKKNILSLVNIQQATHEPLPLLLKNCILHVTNSSASTIEAAMFGKKTILLHKIGNLYYNDLINRGLAKYVGEGQNLESEMNGFL